MTDQVTTTILEQKWSPEQIAERLRLAHPEDKSEQVNHETIYQYLCPSCWRVEADADSAAQETSASHPGQRSSWWYTEHTLH